MTNLLQLLLDQPSDLLYQLYKSDLKPIHLAVAAEKEMRDACLYLKRFVPDSACSDKAKEYLSTLDGYILIIFDNGKSKQWRLNDLLHRQDGPAIELADGDKEWYVNGKRHREDGPAYKGGNGEKQWWLNGKQVTEQDVINLAQHAPLTKSLQELIDQHGKEQLFIALSKI